jgi:hypothetical protein
VARAVVQILYTDLESSRIETARADLNTRLLDMGMRITRFSWGRPLVERIWSEQCPEWILSWEVETNA